MAAPCRVICLPAPLPFPKGEGFGVGFGMPIAPRCIIVLELQGNIRCSAIRRKHQPVIKTIKKYIWWSLTGFDGFDGKHLPPKATKNHQRPSKKYLMKFDGLWRLWWKTSATKGHQKPPKTIKKHIWWSLTGFDGFDGKHLPPKAIKNHQRPSKNIFDEVWRDLTALMESICHQRPSKTIKKHQRHRRLTLGSDPLLSTSHDRSITARTLPW